jgi:hypothetical protein
MCRPSFRNVVTALSLACLPVVFTHEALACPPRPAAVVVTAGGNAYAWCLQNDAEGAADCSFNDRNQCEATAAVGLGECVRAAPSALTRD